MNKLLQAYNKVKLFLYLFFRIQYLIFKGIFTKSKSKIYRRAINYGEISKSFIDNFSEGGMVAKDKYLEWWNENVPNPENPVRLRDKQLTSADFPSENPNPPTKEDIDRLYTMHLFVKRNRPLEEREKSMGLFKEGEAKDKLQIERKWLNQQPALTILEKMKKTFLKQKEE
jgi:hypothetical protein